MSTRPLPLNVKVIAKRVLDGAFSRASRYSFNLDDVARLSAAVTSANYVAKNMQNITSFKNKLTLIDFCCSNIVVDGLVLEFGVYSGLTINQIASRIERNVFGFDSFQGLPEDWRPGFEKGTFATSKLPAVRSNVNLVVGWFDDTLPAFMEEHREQIALLHIDCDLYSSTKTILDWTGNKITEGTIVIFDEYFNYPGWEVGEYKAFQEFVNDNSLSYKYIGYVPSSEQVAIQITSAQNK